MQLVACGAIYLICFRIWELPADPISSVFCCICTVDYPVMIVTTVFVPRRIAPCAIRIKIDFRNHLVLFGYAGLPSDKIKYTALERKYQAVA